MQRWLNQDPIGENGGINLYAFNYNSPLSFVDPDGQNAAAIGTGARGAAAGAGIAAGGLAYGGYALGNLAGELGAHVIGLRTRWLKDMSFFARLKPISRSRAGKTGLLPPVDSPQAAVKVGVAYQVKQAMKGKA